MSEFFKNSLGGNFSEHYNFPSGEDISSFQEEINDIYFINSKKLKCIEINYHINNKKSLSTSYFVGVDWITESKAIYVEPKIINSNHQTNYLHMLFSILKRPEMASSISNLYEVKWDKKEIAIEQNQDLLTPLLVVEFLR